VVKTYREELDEMDKSLDPKALLEMMLKISRKGEETASMKGKDVIEEFVQWLRPFYQDRYREKG